MSILLYRAGREGRLLVDGVGFALVERPAAVTGAGRSVRGLRALDEWWDLLAGLVPVLLLMLASIPIGLLGASSIALGVVATAIVVVAALMTVLVRRQLRILLAARSRLVGSAIGQLRAWHPKDRGSGRAAIARFEATRAAESVSRQPIRRRRPLRPRRPRVAGPRRPG